MEVHASLRHLRMAPRKVRLVVDLVRGLPVTEAETRLSFLMKDAARPVLKLLRSAMANAAHNFKLDPTTLKVATITADAGVTLKRSMPRAMGRATPIRKRTTHINLVLKPIHGAAAVQVPAVEETEKKVKSEKTASSEPASKPKRTAKKAPTSTAPRKTASKKSANA